MSNEKELNKIVQRLDTLIKLSALTLLKDKTKKDQILLLSEVGMERNQIADIVGTTPLSVSVVISRNKSNKAKEAESEDSGKDK
jgi:transcriptional regulator